MDLFLRSFMMIVVLLNPFILSIYLLDVVRALEFREFARQLSRAMTISFVVFASFAWAGEALFESAFQVRFFAFRIFGGITFLIIGIRLIMGVPQVAGPRPAGQHVAASIAMPFIIGPGTISASVMAGSRLDWGWAAAAIGLAQMTALAALLLFKRVHDHVRTTHEPLMQRYTEIVGRATALFAGSFAIDMILRGVECWLEFVAAQP